MSGEKRKKINSVIIFSVLAFALFILVIFDFLHKETVTTEKYTVAMGTVVTQKILSDKEENAVCDEIASLIDSLENRISRHKESSEIYLLNKNNTVSLSGELGDILKRSQEIYNLSVGAFDITVGKLTSLWNIGQENADVPSQKEIDKALPFVDGSKVRIEGEKAFTKKGQAVDLGAVGKGLACDEIREYLEKTDISGAVISVGGSILLYGENNGGKWNVGIRDPNGESGDYMGTLTLESCCISTSGDYERVLRKDGKTYHHILDPKTGYPAQSGLKSVTIVCENGFLSDALSTACFVLGLEKGRELLEKENAEAVFITDENEIFVTDGLKNCFSLTSDAYNLAGE